MHFFFLLPIDYGNFVKIAYSSWAMFPWQAMMRLLSVVTQQTEVEFANH